MMILWPKLLIQRYNLIGRLIRTNKISKLVDANGHEVEDENELRQVATDFFLNLFSSDGIRNVERILSGISQKIIDSDDEFLMRPFSIEEVYGALNAMGPLKALRTDGFPPIFFQKFWSIVGAEFCLGFLNYGRSIEIVNKTEIVLLPKIANPTHLANFRPISICMVIYKIIAKALANRLQRVIGNCIDKAQSTFVPGRLIFDNVILAYELLYTYRQK